MNCHGVMSVSARRLPPGPLYERGFKPSFTENGVQAVLEFPLFAEDATVESYFVTRVFDRNEGLCRGRDEIRKLVHAIIARGTRRCRLAR